jgi:hypothetical protein
MTFVVAHCAPQKVDALSRSNVFEPIHGAARLEHLALVSGNRLATHADGWSGPARSTARIQVCLAEMSSAESGWDCVPTKPELEPLTKSCLSTGTRAFGTSQ